MPHLIHALYHDLAHLASAHPLLALVGVLLGVLLVALWVNGLQCGNGTTGYRNGR